MSSEEYHRRACDLAGLALERGGNRIASQSCPAVLGRKRLRKNHRDDVPFFSARA
jgi:hypothetical protein